MSELDREQSEAIEDETDDTKIPDDEIEAKTMAAEMTGQRSLKKMISWRILLNDCHVYRDSLLVRKFDDKLMVQFSKI